MPLSATVGLADVMNHRPCNFKTDTVQTLQSFYITKIARFKDVKLWRFQNDQRQCSFCFILTFQMYKSDSVFNDKFS